MLYRQTVNGAQIVSVSHDGISVYLFFRALQGKRLATDVGA